VRRRTSAAVQGQAATCSAGGNNEVTCTVLCCDREDESARGDLAGLALCAHLPRRSRDRLARNVGPPVTTRDSCRNLRGRPAVAVVVNGVCRAPRWSPRGRAGSAAVSGALDRTRRAEIGSDRSAAGTQRGTSRTPSSSLGSARWSGRTSRSVQPARPRAVGSPGRQRSTHLGHRVAGLGTAHSEDSGMRQWIRKSVRRRSIAESHPTCRPRGAGAWGSSVAIGRIRSDRLAWSSHALQPGRRADPAGCGAVDRRSAVSGTRRCLSRFCLPEPPGRR
jgi:hypothetical protein